MDSTEDVLRQYILEPVIPVNEPKPHFQPRVPTVESLYDIPPAPLSTRIVPERCQETGKIIDFIEIPIENAGSTAKNSMSLKREPGPGDDSTRGSASYFPFWPGGFDEPEKAIQMLDIDNSVFEKNLKNCPPGFANGMVFADVKSSDNGIVDLLSAIEQEVEGLRMWDSEDSEEDDDAPRVDPSSIQRVPLDDSLDESLLNVEQSSAKVLKIGKMKSKMF